LNLAEKLKNFIANKEVQDKTEELSMKRPSNYPRVDEVLEAKELNTPFGEHLMAEMIYSSSFKHGNRILANIFDTAPDTVKLIAKDSNFEEFDFSRCVFIDTETTGLAGGTGTLAFLIGLGFFEGERFRVIQYFMRDYDEETAVLYTLANLLREFDSIVSFNGKSYDIPLLSTRYMLNRMENPFNKAFHLDLLSSARRLYKERFESVSLSSLETNLLSLGRKGDIPGYEIPSVYFQYLRDRNPHPLKPIFYHNRMDILSMVTLSASIAESFDDPFATTACADQDFYCLGRVFQDMGMIDRSIDCYKRALDIPGVRGKAYIQLSLLFKRQGQWEQAEKLWLRMIDKRIHVIFALVELAKYYEHRVKDYNKALAVSQKALEEACKKASLTRFSSKDEIAELKKRCQRIEGKKGK
jgi:uncharacterized protein YprB with RNaseH-like and TPR domain